jgi:hypothetical protein
MVRGRYRIWNQSCYGTPQVWLAAQISTFLWSGANSIRERDRAARNLAEYIRTKQAEYTGSAHVLIAHSHGGNVALRALEHLGSETDNLFVVTLATPFAEILPADPSTETTRIPNLIWVLATAPLSLLLIILESFLPWALVLIIALLLFYLFITYGDLIADAIIGVKTDEFARLTSISRVVRRHPLLVLRAIDDEAALFLAVGAIGNRLSPRMARWMYVGSAVAMIVGAFPLLLLFGFNWVTYLTVLSTVALFQVAWLFVPGLFKAFYGRELVFGSYRCEISSHSVPDSVHRETEIQPIEVPNTWGTVVTLHQTAEIRRGLRHGIYSHPQCAERIAGWLKGQLSCEKGAQET